MAMANEGGVRQSFEPELNALNGQRASQVAPWQMLESLFNASADVVRRRGCVASRFEARPAGGEAARAGGEPLVVAGSARLA